MTIGKIRCAPVYLEHAPDGALAGQADEQADEQAVAQRPEASQLTDDDVDALRSHAETMQADAAEAEQYAARSRPGRADQAGKAATAAWTARSTSPGVPSGTVPMMLPSAADWTAMVASDAGLDHWPPM